MAIKYKNIKLFYLHFYFYFFIIKNVQLDLNHDFKKYIKNERFQGYS
jgi:hypothetical protein